MSQLTRARARYLASLAQAERDRVAFVRAIRAEHTRGRSYADIARELGLSKSRVSRLAAEK